MHHLRGDVWDFFVWSLLVTGPIVGSAVAMALILAVADRFYDRPKRHRRHRRRRKVRAHRH